MKNINFYRLVDQLFLKIEDYLNLYDNEVDIDYEIQNYILTVTFTNKYLIIINKQESLQQIWMATTVNGHHFNYKDKTWICNRSGKTFWKIFHNACSFQLNKKLIFDKNKFF